MGRKPLNPDDKKIVVTVRLKQKTVDELEKLGSRQEIIENAVENYLNDNKNDKK